MALNLAALRTPGVYVDEIALLPPSVAAVETAIPAFIGYTQFAKDELARDQAFPYIRRISSLLDYEQYFGGAPAQNITVTVTNGMPASVALAPLVYNMHYALRMYFANGGGPCHIVSVGAYVAVPAVSKAAYLPGLAALNNIDEPTLLLFPDALQLATATDYHDILGQGLAQCQERGDRFLLCDIYKGDGSVPTAVADFRDGIGINNLKYAAAYYPWLKTSMNFNWHGGSVTFSQVGGILDTRKLTDVKALILAGQEHGRAVQFQTLAKDAATPDAAAIEAAIRAAKSAVAAVAAVVESFLLTGTAIPAALATAQTNAATALSAARAAAAKAAAGAAADNAVIAAAAAVDEAVIPPADLAAITAAFTGAFESKMRQLIEEQRVVMPPTPAVAGAYVMVDNTRGVWKAPANVSLTGVIQPTVFISDEGQRALNVDDLAGKSINAIRTFTGKGTLIWGARTLAGQDNEWRYVNVRRLFNMIEESVKKASGVFVFEPNDANTWVKVKAMCENFLTLLWRQGALAGSKPEDAFQVFVGLNETMTADDILSGRLIVELHLAAVRPAEFIVLRFAHKMQTS